MNGAAAAAEEEFAPSATRVLVEADVLLDARLAIYHRTERWLAVADVHFGYEISQRAAGALFPRWGMDSAEARLRALLADYRPARLVIVGDFVHDRAAGPAGQRLLGVLRECCEVVLVAGNHDRGAIAASEMCEFHATKSFCFYHGDNPAPPEAAGRREVIGHHHPSGTLSDGAGVGAQAARAGGGGEPVGAARVLAVGGGRERGLWSQRAAVVVQPQTRVAA